MISEWKVKPILVVCLAIILFFAPALIGCGGPHELHEGRNGMMLGPGGDGTFISTLGPASWKIGTGYDFQDCYREYYNDPYCGGETFKSTSGAASKQSCTARSKEYCYSTSDRELYVTAGGNQIDPDDDGYILVPADGLEDHFHMSEGAELSSDHYFRFSFDVEAEY